MYDPSYFGKIINILRFWKVYVSFDINCICYNNSIMINWCGGVFFCSFLNPLGMVLVGRSWLWSFNGSVWAGENKSCDQELQEEKPHTVCCGCFGNQLLPVVLVWRSAGASLWYHIPHALWVLVLDLLDSHLPYYCVIFNMFSRTLYWHELLWMQHHPKTNTICDPGAQNQS